MSIFVGEDRPRCCARTLVPELNLFLSLPFLYNNIHKFFDVSQEEFHAHFLFNKLGCMVALISLCQVFPPMSTLLAELTIRSMGK